MCVVVQEYGLGSILQSPYIRVHGFPGAPGKTTLSYPAIAVHRVNYQYRRWWIVVETILLFLFFVVGYVAIKPRGPRNDLHSFTSPFYVCPETIVEIVTCHPNTVYDNSRNQSLGKTLTCDQQHHIGAEDHPAPVDQGFYQGPCSCFQDYELAL